MSVIKLLPRHLPFLTGAILRPGAGHGAMAGRIGNAVASASASALLTAAVCRVTGEPNVSSVSVIHLLRSLAVAGGLTALCLRKTPLDGACIYYVLFNLPSVRQLDIIDATEGISDLVSDHSFIQAISSCQIRHLAMRR